MNRPPKDFDLSTSRMPGNFYVPPKARDPIEVARRRALSPGELVLEQQQKGIRIARLTLEALTEKDAIDFAVPLFSLSALNTAWHLAAEPARAQADGVRRRRFKYPWLHDWKDANHLYMGVKHTLTVAETLAARVTDAHARELPGLARRKFELAGTIGNASLVGMCAVGLGNGPIPSSPLHAQLFAREQGFRMSESRFEMAEAIGSAPTFAQLPDQDSDVTLFLRRNAPDQVFDAFHSAVAA